MPDIIGLLASPILEGNTAVLLDRTLQGAHDAGCTTELIPLVSLDFQACQEIYYCKDHETCIFIDDMTQMYPKFAAMHGLVVAAPVMNMAVPGPLKTFIDRFQVFFTAKYFRKQPLVSQELRGKRKGLFLAISGTDRPDVFTGSRLTMKSFFDVLDCAYHDEFLVPGMDRIRDISSRPDLLDAAYQKGFTLGTLLAQGTPYLSPGIDQTTAAPQ